MVGANVTCKHCKHRHPAEISCPEAHERATALASAREHLEHQRSLAEAILPVAMPLRTWMATQFVAAFISGAQASGDAVSAEGVAQAAVSMANTLIAELNK